MENANQPIWSVSDVNAAVRDMLENSFLPFWVRGEISNLVIHRSGHVYCSLKDDKSQIRATFFGGANTVRQLNIQNGDVVESYGRIGVYEVRGEYQFSMRSIRPAGIGELQMRFEELKNRLAAEGLFDPSRKRPIPRFPRTIGVVTSPTGAAIRDFLQIIDRRFPNMHVQIYPAQVQGRTAAGQVAQGIEFFNRSGCDVIVVTRGGGSMEDLWPFNEEILAHAVAGSRIPVISAVGHEIDFTICDFAADLRVPTPSAAAELVIGSREELMERIRRSEQIIRRSMEWRISDARSRIERLALAPAFREPRHLLENRSRQLDELQMRITHCVQFAMSNAQHRVKSLEERLNMLNPRRQLERGYAIVTDSVSGTPVTSAAGQDSGKALCLHFADSTLDVSVN